MCGIAGFLDWRSSYSADALTAMVNGMTSAIQHRGPDAGGCWVDAAAGIALGHRRLSIIDLSEAGAQPMVSASGRYVISYNGEIYNYRQLRDELLKLPAGEAPAFRGHSDTELALAAIERHGLAAAVRSFNGMFAFALWDRREQTLHLVRDRMGEKPVYYGWMGNSFLFGSELKALRAHRSFTAKVDREALALLMRDSCVPAPRSIYKGIFKLPAACILTLPARDTASVPQPVPFWSLSDAAELATTRGRAIAEGEAMRQVELLLREAVSLRMISDVPLGIFLSGGIDSSLLSTLMQQQSDTPVKTFTIGFTEPEYNEAPFAKAVANHLGTDHTELYISPELCREIIPRLPTIYDEPFADSSQIPTFLVSQLARSKVTVSLSGDGADEIFGGYNRYQWTAQLARLRGLIPPPLRGLASRAIASLPAGVITSGATGLRMLKGQPGLLRYPLEKAQKIADVLQQPDPLRMYEMLLCCWPPDVAVVPGSKNPPRLGEGYRIPPLNDVKERWMLLDSLTYLPDDILVKVDRASMSVSLESRAPYLDHRLVELAWTLPLSMKIRGTTGKWILRQILRKHLPEKLFERPKTGFGIPVGTWLRGPLRDWAEHLLSEQRLRREGFFDPAPIRQAWQQHLTGKRDWFSPLWNVLMFQAWLQDTHAGGVG